MEPGQQRAFVVCVNAVVDGGTWQKKSDSPSQAYACALYPPYTHCGGSL